MHILPFNCIIHESHDLNQAKMNAWLEGIKNQTEMDFYATGIKSNYPSVNFAFYKTFYPPAPISASLAFYWDEKLTKRRGTSLEGNQSMSISYDMPAIIASVPSPEPEEVIEEVVVEEVQEIAPEVIEKTVESLPVTEKPKSIEAIESEQPEEKSSNWLLWVILLIVLIGVIAFVSRKRK